MEWQLLAQSGRSYANQTPPLKGTKIWTLMRDQISEPVDTSALGRRLRLDTTRAEQEAEPAWKMLKFERCNRDHGRTAMI